MGQRPIEITYTVTETVSTALETPMEELPPLGKAINLDALGAIVTTGSAADILVSFTYAGLCIHVHSRDTVYVHPDTDEYDVSLTGESHLE